MFLFYVILSPPNEKHTNNSNIINHLNDNNMFIPGLICKTQASYQLRSNDDFTGSMPGSVNLYHFVSIQIRYKGYFLTCC